MVGIMEGRKKISRKVRMNLMRMFSSMATSSAETW